MAKRTDKIAASDAAWTKAVAREALIRPLAAAGRIPAVRFARVCRELGLKRTRLSGRPGLDRAAKFHRRLRLAVDRRRTRPPRRPRPPRRHPRYPHPHPRTHHRPRRLANPPTHRVAETRLAFVGRRPAQPSPDAARAGVACSIFGRGRRRYG